MMSKIRFDRGHPVARGRAGAQGRRAKRGGPPATALAVDGYDAYKTWITDQVEPGPSGKAAGDHYANFIDCVRSRRAQDIHSPIEEAHISTTLVHLANASYRLGRMLKFDPEQEQVVGDEEANRLLRGSYRSPYVVPEQV